MKPSIRSPSGSKRSSGAGGYDLMIPRFPATSLTTKAFRWMHTEGWNDEHMVAFARFRQAPPLGLFSPLPFEKSRRQPPAAIIGRWLLDDAQGQPIGAIEVQGYWRGFTGIHVLVSDCSAPGGWTGEWLDALSFMLSGLLLMTSADYARLLPLSDDAARQLVASDFGAVKPIWTPLSGVARLLTPAAGQTVATVTFDPGTWWERPTAKRDRVALAYLEKRRHLSERRDNFDQNRKPRAGFFLSRLFELFVRRR